MNLDWAISLAIFIIFLTIFFMLVFPLFNPRIEQASTISEIKDRFENTKSENNAVWTVYRALVFVSDSSLGLEPVSLLLPYNWNTSNSSFLDSREFLIDENRIFFYTNMKNSSTYIVSSNSTYNQTKRNNYDLTCTSSGFEVSGEDLDVAVQNSLITQIDYLGETAALNFGYGSIDATSSTDFWNKTFVCKYTRGPHNIYPMANASIIFNYMDSGTVNLTLELEDSRYHRYYDSSAHDIPYNDNNCKTINSNIIDFYDTDGIAFVSDNMELKMCCSNTTAEKINLTLTLRNPYKIILHQGTYLDIMPYTKTRIELGAMQEITGLSYEKLKQLNQSRITEYDQLKSEWAVPVTSDFDWRVSNKTLEK